jgi:uroporphyrinogen decarboxylase
LLGFVGGPWTIGTYIVEGGSTSTYKNIKSMCYTAPHILKALLSHLTKAISEYIIYQVNSGAQCIQIFDSWGGQLPPHVWEKWSKPYIKQVYLVFSVSCLSRVFTTELALIVDEIHGLVSVPLFFVKLGEDQ